VKDGSFSGLLQLQEVIRKAYECKASGITMAPDSNVMIRVNGKLRVMDDYVITEDDIIQICLDYIKKDVQDKYTTRKSYSISLVVDNKIRVRLQFYDSYNGMCISCKLVPTVPKTMEELAIPPVIQQWISGSGITVVSGLADTGKTTTLSAIVDYINTNMVEKVIILEDPVEYQHRNKMSLILTREVGTNTPTYTDGLRDILRGEDVDTVVVGAVRNAQTMESVFAIAESGIRVFTVIPAPSVVGAIERIANMFPLSDYERVCRRLSTTLNGILVQKLLPKLGGGRVLAAEIFTNVEVTNHLLHDGKMKEINNELDTRGAADLCSMREYEKKLEEQGLVLYHTS